MAKSVLFSVSLHADLGLDFFVRVCGSVIITPLFFLFFSTISAAQAVTYDCLVSRSVLLVSI